MYDWPEVRDEVDALWSAIARRLGEAGVDAPTGLWRPERVEELWDTPDLLVGQTCGLNVVGDLRGWMEVLGVLDYAVEGCAPGDYRSVLVCRSLDAIHLAAARRAGPATTVLTFDQRRAQAARSIGLSAIGC